MPTSESWQYSKNRFKSAVGNVVSTAANAIRASWQRFFYVPAIVDNNAALITPTLLSNILDDAAEGDCQEQANLIEWAMECDPKFAAHLLTRQDAVSAANWYFVPAGQLDAQEANYDDNPELREFHDLMAKSGLAGVLRHLNAAVIFGYSACAVVVNAGGVGFQWHPIDMTSIKFDQAGGACLVDEDDEELPLEKLPPNLVTMHFAQTRSGHPARRGLARMLMWFWLFKHRTLDTWARYVARFGFPNLVLRMSRAHFDNDTARTRIISQVRKLAHDGIVATTEKYGIEPITGQAGLNNRLHQEHVAMVNGEYAMLVLGQVGSSEGERGRLGNNRAQEDVRQDKRETDCNALAETVWNSIIVPQWIAFRGGDGADAPQIILRSLRGRALREIAASAKDLKAGGLRMNKGFVQRETGIPVDIVEEGEGEGDEQKAPQAAEGQE